ncbi:NUDIX domain-containing protein [Candidatus Daviesbacteria bacterium]|nr:NUDIX domain-containing protein [Candidatus Daviesbacteria bacterium]
MPDELLDILDAKGNKTGRVKSRNLAHSDGSWHATVHIWMYNKKGEVLLQKRADNLYVYPGLWDISCAGHISAGQTPDGAAIRELSEELGIKIDPKLLKKVKIQKQKYRISGKPGFQNNELNHLYLFQFDGAVKELDFKDGEVGKVKFEPVDRFEKEVTDPILSKKFVPHNYYPLIISAIRAQLS